MIKFTFLWVISLEKEVFFSTDKVRNDLRMEFYRSFFAPFIEITPLTENNFCGEVRVRPFSSLILVDSQYNTLHKYRRDLKTIRKYEINSYFLGLFLQGGHVHTCANGECFNIEAGDILLLDLSLTGQGVACAGHNIHFYIPRELMEKHLKGCSIRGDILFKRNLPISKLLTNYMMGSFNVALDLGEDEANIATNSIVSLLVAGLKGYSSTSVYKLNDYMNTSILKDRVENFIDLHIKDPVLNVELIIERFKVSRAHLYRAFEVDGGVVAVIRKKRLALAYQEISDPLSKLTVTQIAFEYGFAGNNQFYRSFKKYYGITPSELRLLSFERYPKILFETDLYNYFKKFHSTSKSINAFKHSWDLEMI